MTRLNVSIFALLFLTACASQLDPNDAFESVVSIAETDAVDSHGDAADDPAIWLNSANPDESLVLGTDKQVGLYVYGLDGHVRQFLPSGKLNNVDLRQGVTFSGLGQIDLAAATNRSINGVTLFGISEQGKVQEVGSFRTRTIEPYGLCVGNDENGFRVFVTYKTGAIEIFTVEAGKDSFEGHLETTLKLSSQLEGCVFDEMQNVLFVGEEDAGVWRIDLEGNSEYARTLVDAVGTQTGLVADVEGVSLWRGGADSGFLVVSAQAGDRYVVYERAAPNRWVGTFSVSGSADGSVDSVSHTDGLDIASSIRTDAFPNGLMVVQDDSNTSPEGVAGTQNFKFVSWRDVELAMVNLPASTNAD